MTRRATLKDVAAAAGVSSATASFVLNDTPGQTIPEPTRARVREAAERLSYVPHGVARALREGTSRIVLLDTAGIPHGPSLEAFTVGLAEVLAEHGHTLLVSPATGADLERTVATLRPRAVVDLGTLYATGDGDDDGGATSGLAAHTAAQVGHLVRAGHHALAAAMPEDAAMAALRMRQLEEAAHALGASLTSFPLPSGPAACDAALRDLRAAHPDVTAVACYDDHTALTLLAAMRRAGLDAPDDLAVIGFDARGDAVWLSRLTSVAIDAAAYGRRAGLLALGRDPGPVPARPSWVVEGDTA